MKRTLKAAKLLRFQRQKLGWSQEELSQMLKVSQQFIANIESGASKIPSYMIEPLSKVLGLERSTLIGKMVLDYKNFLIEGDHDESE